MNSPSAIVQTQPINPRADDKSHDRLRLIATTCWKLFEKCSTASTTHLNREYGKFRVWCGNLGVRQGGHASLDWRLKDDETTENEVYSMLADLEDDLLQTSDLLSGARLPYEQEEAGSEASSLSDSTVPGELQLRLDAIKGTIAALYQISFLVRNQGTRRLASAKAQSYVPQDDDEAALLESFVYLDKRHIDDLFRDLRRSQMDQDEPLAARVDLRPDGPLADRTLKARCLAASTARRRQLAYWKMHSRKLKSVPPLNETLALDHTGTIFSGTEASGIVQRKNSTLDPTESQSLASIASTVRDMDGNETEFPGPPERNSDQDPFECPYCFVLCHPEDATRRRWKKHILEDLRPYICTYADCQESLQLYGNHRDWIAHEKAFHRDPKVYDISVPEAGISADQRTQCPICLLKTTELPNHTTLPKHLASHLERISLNCLPLGGAESWGNEVSSEATDDSLDHHVRLLPKDSMDRNAHKSAELLRLDEDSRLEDHKAMPTELRGSGTSSEKGTKLEDVEKIVVNEGEIGALDAKTWDIEDTAAEDYTRPSRGREPSKSHILVAPGTSLDGGLEEMRLEEKRLEEKRLEEKRLEQRRIDEAMRRRLAESGFSVAQIDAIMENERKKKEPAGSEALGSSSTPSTVARVPHAPHVSTYQKFHIDQISTETLRYYDIPWEYDREDPTYTICLREMNKHEIAIMIDHTKRLREGRMLLGLPSEEKKPEYAFYRKRSKSRARDESGEWKKAPFGILEYKR